MSYQRSFDQPESVKLPPCLHLRSKAIYVTGDPDPKDFEDPDSYRFHCWCNKTQHILGVDDQLVDRTTCVAGRDCYRERQ